MPSGRVKFFNTDRGYGFIAPDDGGSDVFVHAHDVEAAGMKTLVEGQLVAYEVGPARDGRSKAVNLRLLKQALETPHFLRQLLANAGGAPMGAIISSLPSTVDRSSLAKAMLDRMEAAAKKALPERRRRMRRLELENSLSEFLHTSWPHFDPAPYTHGWHIDAIAEHLKA